MREDSAPRRPYIGGWLSPRAKALLWLAIAPPILTEVASGNTSVHALLHPQTFLFLLMAYSFPLLVIRETSLRWQLSTKGIFLLGLAYGIVNEGLLAQTLLRFDHVPIAQFDRYVYAAGFNFSWSCLILPWHALFAVLFPLALLDSWFPSCAREPWLGPGAYQLLATLLIALLIFFAVARKPHPQMLICLLAIAVLVCCGLLFRGRDSLDSEPASSPARSFAFGLVSYPVITIGAILLAARRVPAPAYFLFVVVAIYAAARLAGGKGLFRPPANLQLALGAYVSLSLFHTVFGIARHSWEDMLTGALLAAAFCLFATGKLTVGRIEHGEICLRQRGRSQAE